MPDLGFVLNLYQTKAVLADDKFFCGKKPQYDFLLNCEMRLKKKRISNAKKCSISL